MKADLPFQRFQREFARYLRDPHHTARPAGVPARRAMVYQELLFNNVSGFLDRCFPVSASVLGPARWRRLCRTFYRDWPLHNPLFRFIARDFVDYLAQGEIRQPLPAWLPDLARYEWAELAADILHADTPPHDPAADLLHACVVINPARIHLASQWPVHRIGPDYRPRKPQPTHLVVYRDADLSVRFCEINAVTARLLALLAEPGATGQAALRALAMEIGHPNPDRLIELGASLLLDFCRQGVILGAARQS